MPTCPVCGKKVSLFHWDIVRGGCTACTGIDPDALENLLARGCPECGGREVFATTAPALATVQTKSGAVPTRTGPGLFVLGCADCGHAWFRFNSSGAGSLSAAPGWIGQRQLSKLRGQPTFDCPKCGQLINFRTPTGIRMSDDEPRRVYCDRCNEELSRDMLE